MKKMAIVLVLAFCFTPLAWAGQKYNPMEGRFETVPDDYEMKYNAYEGEFSYEDPDAEIEYNPHEGTFDWNPESDSDSYGYDQD